MGDDIGNLLGIQQDSNPNRGGSIPYAPGIIRQFADRLYARADFIVFVYTVIGLIVGGVVGVALKVGFSNDFAAWIVGTAIVAVAFLLGQERAFHLRLQAQLALCQVQIEENTRKSPG